MRQVLNEGTKSRNGQINRIFNLDNQPKNMIIEIKIPSPGESVSEVEIASWLAEDGDYVEKDQEIAEIESDKATLPLIAEESGTIKILAGTGEPIEVGAVACRIDTEGKAPRQDPEITSAATGESNGKTASGDTSRQPAPERDSETISPDGTREEDVSDDKADEGNDGGGKKKKAVADSSGRMAQSSKHEKGAEASGYEQIKISPLAKKLMEEKGFSIGDIINGLQRITRDDVAAIAEMSKTGHVPLQENIPVNRDMKKQKMSMLRRNLSKRLVAVKNETAMLTTFNEVDMSGIISLRKKYQSAFTEKHGVKLGFMSFFVKAVTETLKIYPNVNSFIEGDEIVTPEYYDTGIAVQTDKGLMVPVIRNTETLSLAGIEKKILELADKARKNRIAMEDLTGGTFTITNGGIFGSLLSTPVLNPPQSGILGMHNIVERPVAVEGKVEIRPMMYIALSYDHRVIDGRDSVGFLVKVRELLENPAAMLSGGKDPVEMLLGI